MALPCVDFDIADFVDRESEFKKIVRTISLRTNNSDERVLHLVGRSRVGKSFLLCRCQNHIVNLENIQLFAISFMPYSVFSGDQFTVQVLGYFYNCIAGALGIPAIVANRTPSDLSNDIYRELDILQRRKTVAFLMDEVSLLSSDQIEALEDYFLSRFINFRNTVLILTGRHAVSRWKEFSLRPTVNKNIIELFAFKRDETQEQIELLNRQAVDLALEIHEISGGSPGNNKLILDQARGNPLQFNKLDAIRVCNQDLYDAIDDVRHSLSADSAAELLPALEALCVLQDFDKEYEMPIMLAVHNDLQGVWDVRRTAFLLSILSGIQVGPGKIVDWDMGKSAYAIEEQIRDTLEKELKIRNKDLWGALHCTAMKLYAQWAKDYDSDIYADKSRYHKAQLVAADFDPDNC